MDGSVVDELLLHQKTRDALEQSIRSQNHALLIIGRQGAGKQAVSDAVATGLLGTSVETSPYFLRITADGKSIGIEQIREVQKFVQLKTAGANTIRRVISIDGADTMTTEAQNALLKILEEPPADTVLILTADRVQNIRPTIHSRVQTITIVPPTKAEVLDFFATKGFPSADVEKAYLVSNGQIGLMSAILESVEDHSLANQITAAKKLYGQSAFERLTMVDQLAKQKEDLPDLLYACKRICISALEQSALKGQTPAVKSWHKQLRLIVDTESSLKHNPNTKLLLTDLFISM
jgi:replication-associated recombination protein RarA